MISYLAVHPNHRHKGYARFMVKSALSDMKARGIPSVGILIAQHNEEAKAFWANWDFKVYQKNFKDNETLYDCYALWFKKENNKGE